MDVVPDGETFMGTHISEANEGHVDDLLHYLSDNEGASDDDEPFEADQDEYVAVTEPERIHELKRMLKSGGFNCHQGEMVLKFLRQFYPQHDYPARWVTLFKTPTTSIVTKPLALFVSPT